MVSDDIDSSNVVASASLSFNPLVFGLNCTAVLTMIDKVMR
jgi:hypothetical protein